MSHTETISKAIAAVRPVFRFQHRGAYFIAHSNRVWYRGRHLARSVDVNPAILAWFAYLHDSQGCKEYSDSSHGRRATDVSMDLHYQGVITEARAIEFEQLCEVLCL